MKKMVKWYEVLQANNVDFTAKQQEAEEPVEAATEETEKKPKAKKAKATAETDTETATAEAPKKTRKKKTEE
jgi:hypothetical protein